MWIKHFLCSSVGAKYVMAITGLLLVGFLVAHLAGNLLVFAGPDAFNEYAANMQSLGPLLWVARLGLLTIFLVHILSAIRLVMLNRRARPVGYHANSTIQASFASRVMPMSGIIALWYVVYHICHFTLRVIEPEFAGHLDYLGRHDAYRMVVLGFQQPLNVVIYIVGMLVIGSHLSHGFSSLFQSIGLNHPKYTPSIRLIGPVFAWALVLMFLTIPVSVITGCVTL
jgi:succinate dehydrogenase / fumarate reductase, cytochrome b subunit